MTQKRGVTLQQIVQTAIDIADREGLAAVTLSAVAERLQIRPPSLYNHVNGMDGLHSLLALNGLNALLETVCSAKEGKAGREALLAIAEAYVEFARKHPGLYAASLSRHSSEDPDCLQVSQEISSVLAETVRECGIQDGEELHIVRGFRSMLHGFAALEASGVFGLEIQVNDSLRYSVKRYLHK
jgi:AcrR family transcriptional regulator